MIFKTGKDIENDIKYKISYYLKDNDNVNLKTLSSLLSVYLQELKNINELGWFNVGNPKEETQFSVSFIKNGINYYFIVSLVVEMRNIKIEKIKSNKIISFEIL